MATFDKTVQNESFAFDELTLRTPYTLTNPADLKGHVEDSEKNGYAIDDHKSDEDVFCVGAAIVNPIDRNHYAFSISIPYYRLTDQLKEDMIAAVMKTKTIIEFQLDSYTD